MTHITFENPEVICEADEIDGHYENIVFTNKKTGVSTHASEMPPGHLHLVGWEEITSGAEIT